MAGAELASVGARLRYARKCRGYTVALVAKYVGCSAPALKAYESALRSIAHDGVRLLAYVYDVPVDWLLMRTHGVPCQPPERVSAEQRLRYGTARRDPERELRARWRSKPPLVHMPR